MTNVCKRPFFVSTPVSASLNYFICLIIRSLVLTLFLITRPLKPVYCLLFSFLRKCLLFTKTGLLPVMFLFSSTSACRAVGPTRNVLVALVLWWIRVRASDVNEAGTNPRQFYLCG